MCQASSGLDLGLDPRAEKESRIAAEQRNQTACSQSTGDLDKTMVESQFPRMKLAVGQCRLITGKRHDWIRAKVRVLCIISGAPVRWPGLSGKLP